MAIGLLSLDDARDYLNLEADTEQDAWLTREINAVSSYLERYLNRSVVARTYREIHGAEMDNYTLYLPNTPILEVESIHDDPDLKFEADSLLTTDDYNVFDDRIEFRLYQSPLLAYETRQRWRRLYIKDSIQIVYVGGYAEIEVPFGRTRIDFREEAGGDAFTVYLDFGTSTPNQITDRLNKLLNDVGTHSRSVSFDYQTRKFTITQTDGQLTLLPSVTGEYEETESALPLLGFTGDTFTSSPAVSATVTLGIPEALKWAASELLSIRYDKGSHGRGYRGLKSQQIGSTREEYATPMTNAAMPDDIAAVLTEFRRWVYV